MDHVNPESLAVTPASADKSRRYPDDFKRDAVRLVTEEKYKFKAAAKAVGVGPDPKTWHPASTQKQRVFAVIRRSACT